MIRYARLCGTLAGAFYCVWVHGGATRGTLQPHEFCRRRREHLKICLSLRNHLLSVVLAVSRRTKLSIGFEDTENIIGKLICIFAHTRAQIKKRIT